MSLKRINWIIALILTIVVTSTFIYSFLISKDYFTKENILHIKGDILELGYTVAKDIEVQGFDSSLNLLYKSLATHREYKVISIAVDNKIIISTDRKKINQLYATGIHLDQLTNRFVNEDINYFHEFTYFDKGTKKEIFLIIDLDYEYLLNIEEEIKFLISEFLGFITLIMVLFILLMYYINIRPLIKLNRCIKNENFKDNDFFIEEYSTLQNAFKEKFNHIKLLNKTLEEKVEQRTNELTKTNYLFKEAQKMASLGNWEWNIQENTLSWSDEIYMIFGLRPQEFAATYDAFINTIHKDDRELVQKSVQHTLDSGEDYSIVHRITLPDGSEKIVNEYGRVELDTKQKPFRMIGTVHDITESYKREKELELQARLLNSVTDSIFVHNMDGSFIYINEAAYKNRGYTKDEMFGMKVQDLDYHDERIGSEVYAENMNHIFQQIEEKGVATFEVSHKCKNGDIIPLEITSRDVREEENHYLISIARDISERKSLYGSLEKSEKQYRALVENSQIGIFSSKLSGEIVYVNDAIVNILGYDSQEELYKQKAITSYKFPEQRSELLHELTKNGKVDSFEATVLNKHNEEKIILISAHIEDDTLSGVFIDITESKKAVEEITKLSKAMEEIDDIIMISDRSGILTYVNDAYINHTGYSREESIGKSASLLKSAKHDKTFYKELWQIILSGEVYRGLVINRKKDGELYYEEKTISPIKDEKGKITSFVSTGKDITDRIEMQQDLEKLASTDQLTGIYNRHKFEELYSNELERAKRYKKPLSLVMFDIDHFKNVNDTYGHDAGDAVLQRIAKIIKENIRTSDIFARWGGEEFLILCIESELNNAAALAEKLRTSIESEEFDKVGRITSSFGVASYIDKEAKDIFIKRADDALYIAKNEGRNRVVST